MTQRNKVVVDANVLYSRTLRDWFGLLKTSPGCEIFTVCWTEDIMAEVIYHLRRSNPHLDGVVIANLRDQVERGFADGKIWAYLSDAKFAGGDPNDAHVHAAAVACGAGYVVTNDVKGLVPIDGTELPYEIYTADEFLVLVDDSAPDAVKEVVLNQWKHYVKRRREVDLPHALRQAGAEAFASSVAAHSNEMRDQLERLIAAAGTTP